MSNLDQKRKELERIADKATKWIGSLRSLVVHTILFIGAFVTVIFGAPLATVLLVLTTIVSLEAIYLAIFIQMSVNKNTKDIEEISVDIDEIQEDVDEIQEDVEEIQEDIDEIEKDVDEIQEDVEDIEEGIDEDEEEEKKRDSILMDKIEHTLAKLMSEIEEMKKNQK